MLLKAVVTGATGFLGREVKTAFEKAGWKVVGTGLTRANPPSIRKLDLTDASAISALFDEEKYSQLLVL